MADSYISVSYISVHPTAGDHVVVRASQLFPDRDSYTLHIDVANTDYAVFGTLAQLKEIAEKATAAVAEVAATKV